MAENVMFFKKVALKKDATLYMTFCPTFLVVL